MTDKELWEKSKQWDREDDGRGKLKILESVEKFAELVRADERNRATRENAYVLAERERFTDAAMKAAEKGINTALTLEREACAKLIDEFELPLVAEAIRARGQA